MVTANRKVNLGTPDSKRAMASAPRGRLCEAGGCATVLSIYNPSSWCSVHEGAGRLVDRRGHRI